MLVLYDENHVEPGQDRRLKVDVLEPGGRVSIHPVNHPSRHVWESKWVSPRPRAGRRERSAYLTGAFFVVIPTPHRICRRQHACSRVQNCRDTRLRDGYSLLFHRLVYGHPILIPHLVELVYTNHPSVRQDHCTAFKIEFSLKRKKNGAKRITGFISHSPSVNGAQSTEPMGNYREGEDDEKRSSSPIRGPAAPPRSNLPRLILYQMCTQQLERPIVFTQCVSGSGRSRYISAWDAW